MCIRDRHKRGGSLEFLLSDVIFDDIFILHAHDSVDANIIFHLNAIQFGELSNIIIADNFSVVSILPVSYTHLDVYKRQVQLQAPGA